MPRELKIRPQARADLDDIWEFIAQDNIVAADRVLRELEQCAVDLLGFPGKGRRRQDSKDPSLHSWGHYDYLLMYRFDDRVVELLRVLHGRRDLGRLLDR